MKKNNIMTWKEFKENYSKEPHILVIGVILMIIAACLLIFCDWGEISYIPIMPIGK